MVIECIPAMSIAAGEKVAVGLAGFTPPANGRLAVQIMSAAEIVAVWDTATSQVPFTLPFPVGPGTLLRIM
jgi:hypothetical protein